MVLGLEKKGTYLKELNKLKELKKHSPPGWESSLEDQRLSQEREM